MTGEPRLLALIDAVRYCVRRGIDGAFVECGVWRGGSVLAAILTLQDLGVTDRKIYLYDTFEGMPAPGELDRSPVSGSARDSWERSREPDGRAWPELFGSDVFDEESVRKTLLDTGYPADHIHVVPGRVEETLPAHAPDRVALLRLDTDWYDSTKHELEHLYPRLAPGGVLIVDDYGHWEGARRAVDEHFAESAAPILLSRIDYTGRIGVKQ
jgi:hypothetical protein